MGLPLVSLRLDAQDFSEPRSRSVEEKCQNLYRNSEGNPVRLPRTDRRPGLHNPLYAWKCSKESMAAPDSAACEEDNVCDRVGAFDKAFKPANRGASRDALVKFEIR